VRIGLARRVGVGVGVGVGLQKNKNHLFSLSMAEMGASDPQRIHSTSFNKSPALRWEGEGEGEKPLRWGSSPY
jgi:hypothetical protein